jgi:putative oxidoreductase
MNDITKTNKAINISLWIAQGLMAAMFIMAGASKSFQPIDALATDMPWVNEVSSSLVRFIGISELLGGIGIIIPSLLRIKPFLTVWAAYGLIAVMVLAAGFHASRGEFGNIGANIIFIAIIAFVAWGRSKKAPILAKV